MMAAVSLCNYRQRDQSHSDFPFCFQGGVVVYDGWKEFGEDVEL